MNQAEQELFQHGSTWVRADFHLHTKADSEFSYTGNEDFYYNSYIDALRTADIRVGVITNHNKFDKKEYDALRKIALKQGIYLLPGVELSVGDGTAGIHTNIVFSESWLEEGDLINPFLAGMFPGKTVEQYQTENGRSDKTILQVVEELEKVGREYFLIFAHVEDAKGLWNEFKGRLEDWRHTRYDDIRQRTLGFQKVRTHDTRKKVVSWLGNWYPAEIEGSDCKSLADVGKGKACYLKIGAFSFEAIKFALRDYTVRVASEPVRHKRSFIKSVKFEGGTLDGQVLHFSPELNTLIGIRGSGKSSVIEAVRFALDIPFGDKVQDSGYKQGLIKHSIGGGGKVTVTAVDRFGQEYEVRRIWEHAPEVFVDGILQPGVSIRETVINKPLYFGQKDLSSSGEGFEKDLVEKFLGSRVDEVRTKIEQQKEKVKQVILRYKKLGSLAERKEEQTQKKLNAEYQLERYKKYGLEDKLKKQIEADSDDRRLNEMIQAVKSLQDGLSSLLADHEDTVRNHALYKSKQNKAFFDGFFVLYKQVIAQLDILTTSNENLLRLIPEISLKKKEFSSLLNNLKEEFAATERAISDELKAAGIPAIRTDEFRQLSKTIDQATAIIAELDKEESKAEGIQKELLKELSVLNELWYAEFDMIQTEMSRVNANHSSLSIEVGFKEDKEAFKQILKDTMRGSNLRDTVYDKAKENFADPIEIFKDKDKIFSSLGTNASVFWDYFQENLELLLTWKVPNRFAIKYKGMELKDHSLGQRASALILFVLSQKEHDVVLIDQPEDDLDNQTIYQDVIKLIMNLKPDTQFIFATHNPNFPVLGDAEMVVSCEYMNQRVRLRPGSIDDKKVQERIVSIMEGGEEAFNKRKEIYGIWKPLNSSK